MTRTVKIAQLSWGKGRTWVRYKARVPAKPIFIPCLTRKSRNTLPSGHCHFRADERRWFWAAAVLTAQTYTTRPSRNQRIKISRKAETRTADERRFTQINFSTGTVNIDASGVDLCIPRFPRSGK